MKRGRRKKIKRLLAMLCLAALLAQVCSIRAVADYSTDRKLMDISSLIFTLLDGDRASLYEYKKECNKQPYVLVLEARYGFESRENIQKFIGIENNVFRNENFSMIYVQTDNGITIGENAFKKVSVDYVNSKVTDMDVNFIGGENKGAITEIGEFAFAYFDVPYGYVHIDNVTGKIGAYAFEQATIRKGFDIEDGLLDEIGAYAFHSFHAYSFHIPDYKKVDECAFSKANFRTFQLSDKVESIGSRIFEGCDALEEITLPAEDHIKEVSADAFPDKKGLRINVPAGYEDLSAYHFDQYQNLTFCLSPEYTTESAVYKQLAATGAEVMIQSFTAGTKTDMQTVKTTERTEDTTTTEAIVTTTQTVATTTEQNATIWQEPDTSVPASTDITVAASTSASTGADKGKMSGKKTSVVGTILTRKGISYRITGKNTAVCTGIVKQKKKITIPAEITYKKNSYRVTELGAKAFYMDKTLECIKLGKNIKRIRSSALEGCTKLKKVTFGKNLTTIEKRAFYKDKNLIRLIFDGEKLRKVEKRAFSRGKKVKKVIIPSAADQKRYYKLLQGAIVD